LPNSPPPPLRLTSIRFLTTTHYRVCASRRAAPRSGRGTPRSGELDHLRRRKPTPPVGPPARSRGRARPDSPEEGKRPAATFPVGRARRRRPAPAAARREAAWRWWWPVRVWTPPRSPARSDTDGCGMFFPGPELLLINVISDTEVARDEGGHGWSILATVHSQLAKLARCIRVARHDR
jgi:hypothetical protein